MTGRQMPDDLLNFTKVDMVSIVKAHNQRANIVNVLMLVEKNLEALASTE
jgi:hypothetical protein